MGKKIPELIVMLTWHDKTVESAIEVFESARDAPAKFWGFKEVGLPEDSQMKILVQKMKDAGKKTFLEVVAYTRKKSVWKVPESERDARFDVLDGNHVF